MFKADDRSPRVLEAEDRSLHMSKAEDRSLNMFGPMQHGHKQFFPKDPKANPRSAQQYVSADAKNELHT